MKNLALYTLIIISIIILGACNNKLDLIGESKETALVYGALNKNESFFYIRLEKLFADENISPVQLARDPNNFYFEDATVTLSTEGWSGTLTKVDATTLGFPRNSGIFADVPNYIYTIPTSQVSILPGKEYTLDIDAGGKSFASKTILIDTVAIYIPDLKKAFNIIPNKVTKLPEIFFDVHNRDAAPSIISGYLTLNYQESTISNPSFIDKSIEFPLFKNVPITEYQVSYSPEEFYKFLASNLIVDPNIIRRSRSFDFKIITGGKEYILYNQSVAANAGITSTVDYPIYSNIDNGIGIFTSKNEQIYNLGISQNTRDSLKGSRFTDKLGFQN